MNTADAVDTASSMAIAVNAVILPGIKLDKLLASLRTIRGAYESHRQAC